MAGTLYMEDFIDPALLPSANPTTQQITSSVGREFIFYKNLPSMANFYKKYRAHCGTRKDKFAPT